MDDVAAGQAVAIMAEGKTHALGLGLTKMSTKDMYVGSWWRLNPNERESGRRAH